MVRDIPYLLGLGSNIAPWANLPRLLDALLLLSPQLDVSSVVVTEPVGMRSAAPFLNAAARVHTPLPPAALKARLNEIEIALGRDRSDPASKVKNRVADVDILARLDAPIVLPSETYLRPVAAELLLTLGVPLAESAPDVRGAVAVDFHGVPIGTHPVRLRRVATSTRVAVTPLAAVEMRV